MEPLSTKRSRRSHPNLKQLTVTPLTQAPLPHNAFDHDDADATPHATYLSSRSVPQTPSILSRSSSRHRSQLSLSRTARSSLALDRLADLSIEHGDGLVGKFASPKAAYQSHEGGLKKQSQGSSHRLRTQDEHGWFVQTAATLTGSNAEYKGQTWLSSRHSSISLSTQHNPDDDYPEGAVPPHRRSGPNSMPGSPMRSRVPSRASSRSRKQSRRPSRVGAMTPFMPMTPSVPSDKVMSNARDDYFNVGPGISRRSSTAGLSDSVIDDDFDYDDEEAAAARAAIEEQEAEDREAESELKRMIRARLGGWWEFYVGWLDFGSVFTQTSEEEYWTQQEFTSLPGADEMPVQPREGPRGSRRKSAVAKTARTEALEGLELPKAPAEAQGLDDASWLLGVIRKVLI